MVLVKVSLNSLEVGLTQLKFILDFLRVVFKSVHSNFEKVVIYSNQKKKKEKNNENSSNLCKIFK